MTGMKLVHILLLTLSLTALSFKECSFHKNSSKCRALDNLPMILNTESCRYVRLLLSHF
jgi:hypothetical protein